ncbi:hypothetical protein MD588_19800 [Photobacterium sp. SDRW27]|uniref:hypothetical protein n=1 Tax=Photobacterium obscurum TaxID=2829490 RepID=UPI002243684A|nr:hypothetical protein [Photobacterium obscurum]MCW8331042.1 hypothetical protein [Photobacterium obscurum]
MKKFISYIGLGVLSAVATNVNASEFGKIDYYHELIQPVEKNGVIEVTVEATTNAEGMLYLPAYDEASVTSVAAIRGTLLSDTAQLVSVHGREVFAYQFEKGNNDVSMMQMVQVADLYKEKKAKLKYSHPGGVKRISYEFVNTAPVTIGKYSGSLSIPQGKELYGVVKPEWSKKKKTFDIHEEAGWKVVEVSKKNLKANDSVEFRVRTYQPSAAIKWTLWAVVLLLSGALLWKRRGVLSDLQSSDKSDTPKPATNG